MIKVKIIYMARKPKRNQEAYTRLGFLPKQKELINTNIEQHVRLGVTHELDRNFSGDIIPFVSSKRRRLEA